MKRTSKLSNRPNKDNKRHKTKNIDTHTLSGLLLLAMSSLLGLFGMTKRQRKK